MTDILPCPICGKQPQDLVVDHIRYPSSYGRKPKDFDDQGAVPDTQIVKTFGCNGTDGSAKHDINVSVEVPEDIMVKDWNNMVFVTCQRMLHFAETQIKILPVLETRVRAIKGLLKKITP
jgi:hypothetical protein